MARGADGAEGAHSEEGEPHARWEGLGPRAVDAVLGSAGVADSSGVAGKAGGIGVVAGEVGRATGVEGLNLNDPDGAGAVEVKDDQVGGVVQARTWPLAPLDHGAVVAVT